MSKKVVVGISGGVDSAVTAFLLKQQGYKVTAVFLYMHELSNDALNDARAVAEQVGVEFVVIDASENFKEIKQYFVSSYQNGKTPNPCIMCNPTIKFQKLYDYSVENNIDFIATGHYAKVIHCNGRHYIKKLEDKKDQSYMLYRLTQEQLSKIMFPMGEYTKDKVREIAKNNNIVVHNKADSQENCFINGKYTDFIIKNEKIIPKIGDFILKDTNEVLGKHKGIIYYTVGQRKGLGISYKSPLFVDKIDVVTNNIYLTTNFEENTNEISIEKVVFQKVFVINESVTANVKLRYSSKSYKAIIYNDNENYKICFKEPAKAATPGQSAVFYDDDGNVLGGGIINKIHLKYL